MATWTCAECNRTFGAVGRGHVCSPGLSMKEFCVGAPPFVEPVVRPIDEHLCSVDTVEQGDLIVDPLQRKVLFKNGPTFCVLDVKSKWVAVGFSLRRSLTSARLSRKTARYGQKFHHVINIADPAPIDAELLAWLSEAYLDASPGSARPRSGNDQDPMVPDDIDFEIAPRY